MRASNILKLLLVAGAILAVAYTVNTYIHIVNKLTASEIIEEDVQEVLEARQGEKAVEINYEKKESPKKINREPPQLPEVQMANQVCDMKIKCNAEKELPVQIVSGAANIIGPSICVGGTWILSNSKGNVHRGLNVAVIDGRTGAMLRTKVFDLYEVDSTEFETFLNELDENEVIIMTTYDDATQRLKDSTKDMLAKLGSTECKTLGFRDNWIFVAGKKLDKVFEKYIRSEKDKNKYGNWPAAITLEECIPML
uniref:protein FAM3C-like n=1 Tax=Styela clava TaxID=7725 RepID=UPI001939BF83|nr:protein FAM3C-like [Styela clava]